MRGWAGAVDLVVAGVQNANTPRGKLEGEAASWRRGLWGGLDRSHPPDNDIQKSNSEVSNNNGATVNLRASVLNKYIPVSSS